MSDTYQSRAPIPKGAKPTATYVYETADGLRTYCVDRYEWTEDGKRHKSFRCWRSDGQKRKAYDLKGIPRVLYRLPQLRQAIAAGVEVIYVTEGEKDADAVARTGAVATTMPHGAGKWVGEHERGYLVQLAGARRIVVIADVDGPAKQHVGERHAQAVAASLRAAGFEVEVRQPATGKDAAEHLAAGRGLAALAPFVEPPATGADFPAVDDEELDSLPDPEWLIEDVLPTDAIALLFGRRSTYKSFVVLDWLLAVQTNTLWLDRHEVRQGQAVYVAGEGWGGIKKRVRVWKRTHSFVGRAGLQLIKGSTLRTDAAVTRLLARITERAAGAPVAIIALDTLNRLIPGIEENTPEAMGRAIGIADQLRAAFPGALILWVHHSGWEDQHERGHSSLGDGSELIVHAAKETLEPLTITLTCTKQKDADVFAPLRLAMVETEADGLTSLSVTLALPSVGPGKPLPASCVDALAALTEPMTSGAWRRAASNLNENTFKWAQRELKGRGLVRYERTAKLYAPVPQQAPAVEHGVASGNG